MTNSKKFESAFIWLSPIPFLLTVIIPVLLNLIFDYSHDLRPGIILMSQIGTAISAMLTPVGIYLMKKATSGNRLRLGLATLMAGLPAVIILLTFSLLWGWEFI